MTPRVAVVGAGVAGAGVATVLQDTAVDVTVFESTDSPGGRTATHRRDGCIYDVGANYVKDGSERVSDLLGDLEREVADLGLVDVEQPVWTFDGDGGITPGDDDRADDHKWTFEAGIDTLARRLLERSRATVRTETRVNGLERESDGRWQVRTTDEAFDESTDETRFDAVALTPPGPRTAEILEGSSIAVDADVSADLAAVARRLRKVPYRSIHSFALHYPVALERPYYALVNTDREHAVGWVSREGAKRGHVPDGETLLVAQMAPDWSAEHRSTPAETAATEVAARVSSLLEDDRLTEPDWTERVVWTHALPDDAMTGPRALESVDLFLASDCVHGEGRAHAALECGLSIGDRLAEEADRTRA